MFFPLPAPTPPVAPRAAGTAIQTANLFLLLTFTQKCTASRGPSLLRPWTPFETRPFHQGGFSPTLSGELSVVVAAKPRSVAPTARSSSTSRRNPQLPPKTLSRYAGRRQTGFPPRNRCRKLSPSGLGEAGGQWGEGTRSFLARARERRARPCRRSKRAPRDWLWRAEQRLW